MDTLRLINLDEKNIKTVFQWKIDEKNPEFYTCREVSALPAFEEFSNKQFRRIADGILVYKIITFKNNVAPLGSLYAFDFNKRNKSAEFGYYLPKKNRQKGIGNAAISLFVDYCFKKLALNKLYATTSSNNYGSIKVLEKNGFSLDGRNREHYWIQDNRYDQLIYSLLYREYLQKIH